MWDSRAVAEDLDRVDAVLGEAAALQEGTVVDDLHALAGEVTGLEQLDAVVLAVLPETNVLSDIGASIGASMFIPVFDSFG